MSVHLCQVSIADLHCHGKQLHLPGFVPSGSLKRPISWNDIKRRPTLPLSPPSLPCLPVQSLVELGLLEPEELERAILSDFNPIRGGCLAQHSAQAKLFTVQLHGQNMHQTRTHASHALHQTDQGMHSETCHCLKPLCMSDYQGFIKQCARNGPKHVATFTGMVHLWLEPNLCITSTAAQQVQS